jgi:hypothetical protein
MAISLSKTAANTYCSYGHGHAAAAAAMTPSQKPPPYSAAVASHTTLPPLRPQQQQQVAQQLGGGAATGETTGGGGGGGVDHQQQQQQQLRITATAAQRDAANTIQVNSIHNQLVYLCTIQIENTYIKSSLHIVNSEAKLEAYFCPVDS